MLIEQFQKGLVDNRNYNCSEKVLNLGNEVLGLGLTENTTTIAAGFGAGMGIQHLCGAISGAIMVLSLKRVKTVARESNIYREANNLLTAIEGELGSLMCDELKARYYSNEIKCQEIIAKVIELLDQQLVVSDE